MKTQFKTLESTADNLPISMAAILPDGPAEPACILQLVHGMCEHKERYFPFMEYMASHGFACFIHDHRGHGASVKDSGDLGYFYEGGMEGMIEDIRSVTLEARKAFPGIPVILFGHSMGSMAVRSFAKRYDNMISALIVCGSPSYNPASGIGKVLANLFRKLCGDRYRPRLIQKISFGSFGRKFRESGSPNAWICSDPEIVEAYDNDPLCSFQFTADGFVNLFSLMQDAYSESGWKVSNPDMPVLFVSGTEDPCLINPCKFKDAVDRVSAAGYRNVHSRLYPSMRHEILNETGKEQVWKDLLDFCTTGIPATK